MTVVALAAGVAQAGGTLLCGTAGDDFVAARAGLRREWVIQVPFDSAGWVLESVTAGSGPVVACSSDGGVHAVQAFPAPAGQPRPGTLLWSRRVGRPGGLGQPAGVGSALVTVARGLEVHAFDAQSGVLRWSCMCDNAVSASAVAAGDQVYCPVSDDGLIRLSAGVSGVTSVVKSAGRRRDTGMTIDQPPIPYSNEEPQVIGPVRNVGAVWINDDGKVIAEVPTNRGGWDVWSFDTRLPGETQSLPAGPPAVQGDTIYVATKSGRLEALRPSAGAGRVLQRAWIRPVFLPGVPQGGPIVAGDRVIVSLGEEGFVAYSATPDALTPQTLKDVAEVRQDAGGPAAGDGLVTDPRSTVPSGLLWRTPCGVGGSMVAVVGDRVWFVDLVGRLASVDLATGEPRECLPLGGFTVPVANSGHDRLVLASPDGIVVSLAPRHPVSVGRDTVAPAAVDPVATLR